MSVTIFTPTKEVPEGQMTSHWSLSPALHTGLVYRGHSGLV